jgi:hypothetical protein
LASSTFSIASAAPAFCYARIFPHRNPPESERARERERGPSLVITRSPCSHKRTRMPGGTTCPSSRPTRRQASPTKSLKSGSLSFVCEIPKHFSKVLYRVILCSEYARVLTFKNVWQASPRDR